MDAVRKLRTAHADLPLVSAKIVPFMQDLPPTHATSPAPAKTRSPWTESASTSPTSPSS
jgi:hypothetical protein